MLVVFYNCNDSVILYAKMLPGGWLYFPILSFHLNSQSMHMIFNWLTPVAAQAVGKSSAYSSIKPDFRAGAKQHPSEPAFDKKGIKIPYKYAILGPLDLWNGAGK